MICQQCADAADHGDVPHCDDQVRSCPCQHRVPPQVSASRERLRRAARRWQEEIVQAGGGQL